MYYSLEKRLFHSKILWLFITCGAFELRNFKICNINYNSSILNFCREFLKFLGTFISSSKILREPRKII